MHASQQQQEQEKGSSSECQISPKVILPWSSASTDTEADDALQEEGFDAAELYAAVKPNGNEPELAGDNPRLRPTLRPYQKRAAAWMVAREEGLSVRRACYRRTLYVEHMGHKTQWHVGCCKRGLAFISSFATNRLLTVDSLIIELLGVLVQLLSMMVSGHGHLASKYAGSDA